jgi:hypothetical protein
MKENATMNRIIPVAVILLTVAPALATASTVDDRQAEQARRIEHGRETGAITWTEGLKLRKQQRDIARLESDLKSDGYLSRSDRNELARKQNQASRDIRSEAHDGWHRLWGLPRVGK